MVFGWGKKKKAPAKKKAAKKVSRSSPAKKKSTSKKSPAKKKGGKKNAFGGYSISFEGRKETMEDIFGKKPIPPNEMTKKLWTYVKQKRLGKKR